jgi:hypothetical protein
MAMHREIEVTCPTCEKTKIIKIPEAIFTQKKFGTVKIQVPVGGVCMEHQFIVFVDTKGIIRGYEKIDLLMRAPSQQELGSEILNLKTSINLFGLYGVFCLIHAKTFNYPAYIIKGENTKNSFRIINEIGNNLLPATYQGQTEIVFLEKVDYDKIKLKEKNAFLMDAEGHILQTPWTEKLSFEEDLVKKALDIMNDGEQLILMQKNILKFITEAEHVKNILEKVKEIYEEDLIERLSREFMIPKVSHNQIVLIKEFIRQWFSSDLPKKITSKVEKFLNLL